jgi:phosphoribosylformylglycinamidine cyclo-ligase
VAETVARAAYADAGVDVEAGDRAVALLRERGAIAGGDLLGRLGGFGAALAIPPGYREPVLVSATDGVGTKLEIARQLGRYDTVGRDLVAMCADDVVCHGAQPLFFLDYVAVGRLIPERVAELVSGVAAGCAEAGCSLVGGETAEHPGVMTADAFDMAGFCVGIVERDRLLDGSQAREGDAVVGLASTGLHSNGYSLVRRLIERHGLDLGARWDDVTARFHIADDRGTHATLGDVLLTPTRIYAADVLALRDDLERGGLRLGGIAHVTGGGLPGNLPRAMPEHLAVAIRLDAWPEPTIFRLLRELGRLTDAELRATFNCGVGMAIVVEPGAVGRSIDFLAGRGLTAWRIGKVIPAGQAGGARYVEVES